MINFNDFIHNEIVSMNKNNSFEQICGCQGGGGKGG